MKFIIAFAIFDALCLACVIYLACVAPVTTYTGHD